MIHQSTQSYSHSSPVQTIYPKIISTAAQTRLCLLLLPSHRCTILRVSAVGSLFLLFHKILLTEGDIYDALPMKYMLMLSLSCPDPSTSLVSLRLLLLEWSMDRSCTHKYIMSVMIHFDGAAGALGTSARTSCLSRERLSVEGCDQSIICP